jgi:hypothetical protein
MSTHYDVISEIYLAALKALLGEVAAAQRVVEVAS